MSEDELGLLPHVVANADEYLKKRINTFWNELRITDDIGVTSWEVLRPIEREVTECLNKQVPDVSRAMSLTYRAYLLIAGLVDI